MDRLLAAPTSARLARQGEETNARMTEGVEGQDEMGSRMTEDAKDQAEMDGRTIEDAKEGRGGMTSATRSGAKAAAKDGASKLGGSRTCAAVRPPLALRCFEGHAPCTCAAVVCVRAHGANSGFGRFGQCVRHARGSRLHLLGVFPTSACALGCAYLLQVLGGPARRLIRGAGCTCIPNGGWRSPHGRSLPKPSTQSSILINLSCLRSSALVKC